MLCLILSNLFHKVKELQQTFESLQKCIQSWLCQSWRQHQFGLSDSHAEATLLWQPADCCSSAVKINFLPSCVSMAFNSLLNTIFFYRMSYFWIAKSVCICKNIYLFNLNISLNYIFLNCFLSLFTFINGHQVYFLIWTPNLYSLIQKYSAYVLEK